MSWSRYNTAAGGTGGVAPGGGVKTNNTYTGGASGYYFDTVGGVAGTTTWSASQAPPGASLAFQTAVTAQSSYLGWNLPASNITRWYRGWFYLGNLTVSSPLARFTGGTGYVDVERYTNGKLSSYCSGPGMTQGNYVLSVNTWYRVELEATFGSGTAQGQVRLYDASGNMLDSFATPATGTVLAPTQIQIGNSNNITDTFYHGLHAVSTSGWIGTALTLPLSLFNGAEGNANGATITAASSGQLGADCFDAVSGPAPAADNSRPNSGLVSYYWNAAAGGYLNWRLPGDATLISVKSTFSFATVPTPTSLGLMWINDTNGHEVSLANNTTSHKFTLQCYSGTLVTGSYVLTAPISVDVHLTVTGFGGTITAQAVIVNSATGGVLDTITSTTGTLTTPTFLYCGNINGYTVTYWQDDICATSLSSLVGGATLPPGDVLALAISPASGKKEIATSLLGTPYAIGSVAGTASSATCTVPLTAPVARGDVIVVAWGSGGAPQTVTGVSDPAGQSWAIYNTASGTARASGFAVALSAQPMSAGQSIVLTVSPSQVIAAIAYGIPAQMAPVGVDVALGSMNAGSGSPSQATGTLAHPYELVLGIIQDANAGGTPTAVSWPLLQQQHASGQAITNLYAVAPGNTTASQTLSGTISSTAWSCSVLSLYVLPPPSVPASFAALAVTPDFWEIADTDFAAGAGAGSAGSGQVPVSGADTALGTESVWLSPASADTASGADAGSASASPADADTGLGTESVWLSPSQADTAAGTDTGSASASLTAADTASGAESAWLRPSQADTASGADAGAASASFQSADTASGADAGTPPAASLTAADTALGTDAGTPAVASLTAADTAAGADAGSASASFQSADAASGADALAALSAALSAPDSAAGAEAGTLGLASPDAAAGADAGTLAAALPAADSAAGADAGTVSGPSVPVSGTDAALGADAQASIAPYCQPGAAAGEVLWSGGGTGSTPWAAQVIPPGTWTLVSAVITSAAGSTLAEPVYLMSHSQPGDQWFVSEVQFYVTGVGTNLLSLAQQGNQSTTPWQPSAGSCTVRSSSAQTHGGNSYSTVASYTPAPNTAITYAEFYISGVAIPAGPQSLTWSAWIYWIPAGNADAVVNATGLGGAADGGYAGIPKHSADTASGTDAGTAPAAALADGDTASGADAGPAIALSSADTALGTDAGTAPAAALADGDTALGTDAGTAPAAALTAADTALGTDSQAAVALASPDSAAGADDGSLLAALPSADTAHGTEAGSLHASLPSADAATGTEAGSLHAALPSADAAAGADSGRAVALSSADAATGAEAVSFSLASADAAHVTETGFLGQYIYGLDGAAGADAEAAMAGQGAAFAVTVTLVLSPDIGIAVIRPSVTVSVRPACAGD